MVPYHFWRSWACRQLVGVRHAGPRSETEDSQRPPLRRLLKSRAATRRELDAALVALTEPSYHPPNPLADRSMVSGLFSGSYPIRLRRFRGILRVVVLEPRRRGSPRSISLSQEQSCWTRGEEYMGARTVRCETFVLSSEMLPGVDILLKAADPEQLELIYREAGLQFLAANVEPLRRAPQPPPKIIKNCPRKTTSSIPTSLRRRSSPRTALSRHPTMPWWSSLPHGKPNCSTIS